MAALSVKPTASIVPLKRPRPVKSCLSCRSKKLKCDREQPCAQCVRANRAEQCEFDEQAGSLGSQARNASYTPSSSRTETSNVNTSGNCGPSDPSRSSGKAVINGSDPRTEEIGELQSRVKRLESLLEEQKRPNSQQTLPHENGIGGDALAGSQANYHGLRNTRSLIALVREPAPKSHHCRAD